MVSAVKVQPSYFSAMACTPDKQSIVIQHTACWGEKGRIGSTHTSTRDYEKRVKGEL